MFTVFFHRLINRYVFVCNEILHLVHLIFLGGSLGEGEKDAAVGLLGGGNSVVQVSTSL
jgi:hypothetical protein